MKWNVLLEKVVGKAVDGGDENIPVTRGHAVPFVGWFIKCFRWQEAATIDIGKEVAEAGYRVGYIVGGKAFVSAGILNDRKVAIMVGPQKFRVFVLNRDNREAEFFLGQGRIQFLNRWLDDYHVL